MSSPIFEVLSARTGLSQTRNPTVAEHRDILKQIQARSRAGARRAMRDHLVHVQAVLDSSKEAAPIRGPER